MYELCTADQHQKRISFCAFVNDSACGKVSLPSAVLDLCSYGSLGVLQVFDGHSGSSTAQFARDHLLNVVGQQPSLPSQLTDALVGSLVEK